MEFFTFNSCRNELVEKEHTLIMFSAGLTYALHIYKYIGYKGNEEADIFFL